MVQNSHDSQDTGLGKKSVRPGVKTSLYNQTVIHLSRQCKDLRINRFVHHNV